MLTPEELTVLTLPAERIQMQMQADVTRRIAQIIAQHGVLTAEGQHLLNRLQIVRFNADYQADIAKYAKMTESEIARVIWEAAETSYGYDKAIFTRRGVPFVPFTENVFMQNLVHAAVDLAMSEWGSVTQTRGFMVRSVDGKLHASETAEFFQKELDRVTLNVTAGTQTYTEAIRQTVTTMKNSGLRSVDYASGVHNRIDVAVRRAILTGVTKVMLEQADEHARQLGTTFFEISWHSGHRPTHSWGGRRFSTAPTSVIDIQTGKPFILDEQLWEESGGTLGEWNCRHNKFPIDEFTPPLHTDTDLKQKAQKEAEKTEYKGKSYTAYTATQRMREMEREMRALRLEGMLHKAQYQELRKQGVTAKELAKQGDPYAAARLRYRVLRAEYTNFAEAFNMRPYFERVAYDMLGNVF